MRGLRENGRVQDADQHVDVRSNSRCDIYPGPKLLLLLLVLGLAAIVLVGCRTEPSTGPLGMISVDWPGYSPEETDDHIAYPLGVAMLAPPGVQRVTTIATTGRADVYIQFDSGTEDATARQRLLAALNDGPLTLLLPSGAVPTLSTLDRGSTIPDPEASEIDYVVVRLNREGIARQGVSFKGVTDAVTPIRSAHHGPNAQLEALRSITLENEVGDQIPLADVAEIEIVTGPSHIVQTWPEEDGPQ